MVVSWPLALSGAHVLSLFLLFFIALVLGWGALLERVGCIVGSGIGGVEWFENNCNAFTAAGSSRNLHLVILS